MFQVSEHVEVRIMYFNLYFIDTPLLIKSVNGDVRIQWRWSPCLVLSLRFAASINLEKPGKISFTDARSTNEIIVLVVTDSRYMQTLFASRDIALA